MKRISIIFLLLLVSLTLTGCSKELKDLKSDLDDIQEDLEDIEYVYPDSKDTVVTLEEFNQLKSGMSESEVWEIIGGQCTNTGTTDLGIGSEYVTVSYGCNGNGTVGSNVILMFQGGNLKTMSQFGLK